VIEFVPKGDPMVKRLLATRRDVFEDYSLKGFRAAFGGDFETVEESPIAESERVLFHFRRPHRAWSASSRRASRARGSPGPPLGR
jgi:hypothetical protein